MREISERVADWMSSVVHSEDWSVSACLHVKLAVSRLTVTSGNVNIPCILELLRSNQEIISKLWNEFVVHSADVQIGVQQDVCVSPLGDNILWSDGQKQVVDEKRRGLTLS